MAEASDDDPFETDIAESQIAEPFRAGFISISRQVSLAADWDLKRLVWRNGLREALTTWHGIERQDIVDECWAIAEAKDLLDHFGVDQIQQDVANEFEQTPPNGNGAGTAQPQQEYRGPDTEAEIVPPKTATLYVAPDPATIPKRAWLHGGHYIRQAATATVAPGGFGKTTLTLYEAVSMVADGLVVWYLSGEDPKVEIDRRIAAHCQHHGIDLVALPGRLYVDDRSTFKLTIGKSPKVASVLFDEASLKLFEDAILFDQIDVVMLDPFVSFHSVPENDNGAIDQVLKRLGEIAYRTNSNIEISHHVRKPFVGQSAITVDDARGGGSIINAARSGRVINRMTNTEAEQAKISRDDRTSYIRLDRGKRNMAPADKATWFRIVSVHLPNGDNVQALEPWDFPAVMDDVSVEDTEWIRELVRHHRYKASANSDDWLGVEIARRLSLNSNNKGDCVKINKLIGIWINNKVFRKMELRDLKSRKKRMFYVAMDAKEDQPDPETRRDAEIVQLFGEEKDDTD
jgi:hypothetical protein